MIISLRWALLLPAPAEQTPGNRDYPAIYPLLSQKKSLGTILLKQFLSF
jgi:hypothetical protein